MNELEKPPNEIDLARLSEGLTKSGKLILGKLIFQRDINIGSINKALNELSKIDETRCTKETWDCVQNAINHMDV